MKDLISEWEYGKGAVKVVGKILVQNACCSGIEESNIENANLILGVVVAPDGKSLLSLKKDKDPIKNLESSVEMWEVELIIIPKKKFSHHTAEKDFYALRADQKLCSPWWQGKFWKKKIF